MKTKFLIIIVIAIVTSISPLVWVNQAYAGCAAPLLGPPGPCFDSFSISYDTPLTQRSIMEDYARNIEMNYGDWQMSDRKWDNVDEELKLPAIICTEFVAEGIKQYRMAKWVDSQRISSFENHKDDWLCDKWLAPIDDGVKIKWDKHNYLSNDTGVVQVIDKDMNLDDKKIDSFDIHVWSDTDHNGIELTIAETDTDSGIFEASVFFTIEDESKGTKLLVEDAVYADHKSNVGFSRIIDESEEPYIDPDNLCPPGKVFDWDICVDECPMGQIASNGVCQHVIADTVNIFANKGFVTFLIVLFAIISISIVFIVWRKRK